MKLKRYLVQGFLLLLCSMSPVAGSSAMQQEPQQPQNPQKVQQKKPRIQTSASEKEVVFKPLTETGKKPETASEKEVVTKGKGTGKKEVAPKKEMATTKKEKRNHSERYMALKSNIAYDAAGLPNLAFEMQFSKHISVELPVICSFWDLSQKHAVRAVAIQPEGRWWLKQAGAGHFFGVHAHVAWFNVKWQEDRYQNTDRPLLGAGVSYGYLLPLSKHWGAEFSLGAGYAHMKYNTYYNIDNGAQIGTETRNYWGITRVGLSLSYRF